LQSKNVKNFHNLKTRQSGGIKFVEAHLVFEEDILLYKAHNVSHKIEDKIKNLDKSSKW
jgi:cation efflux protein